MLKIICILWLKHKFTLIFKIKHQSSKKLPLLVGHFGLYLLPFLLLPGVNVGETP